MICPCKGCTDRKLNCHGMCQWYQQWTEEQENKKAWLREKNANPISDDGARNITRWLQRVSKGWIRGK